MALRFGLATAAIGLFVLVVGTSRASANIILHLSLADPVQSYGTPGVELPAQYSIEFDATLTNDPASTEPFIGSATVPDSSAIFSDLVEGSCCGVASSLDLPTGFSRFPIGQPLFYGPNASSGGPLGNAFSNQFFGLVLQPGQSFTFDFFAVGDLPPGEYFSDTEFIEYLSTTPDFAACPADCGAATDATALAENDPVEVTILGLPYLAPEPSSLAMLLAGLGLIGGAGYWRRKGKLAADRVTLRSGRDLDLRPFSSETRSRLN